jgi:hypothetical protein
VKTSQPDRILTLLRQRGSAGVHSFEFYEMGMPRGAAVIHALKKRGHVIDRRDEPYKGDANGCRYFLARDADEPRAESAPVVEASGLFGAEPKATRNPYDYEAA